MTDARLPERYLMDRRVSRLTDAEFRAYVMAMFWAVSNRTDGTIDRVDLDLVPRLDPAVASALVRADLLTATADGWLLVDFAGTQSTRHELEVLENARRRDREKKARQRAKGVRVGTDDEAVPGDVPGDRSRGTAQAGQEGQAGSEVKDSQIGETWPTVAPLGTSLASPDDTPVCPCGKPLAAIYRDAGRQACPGHENLLHRRAS